MRCQSRPVKTVMGSETWQVGRRLEFFSALSNKPLNGAPLVSLQYDSWLFLRPEIEGRTRWRSHNALDLALEVTLSFLQCPSDDTGTVLFSVGGNDTGRDLKEAKVIGPVLEAGHHRGCHRKSDITASYWPWIFRLPHLSKKTNIDLISQLNLM